MKLGISPQGYCLLLCFFRGSLFWCIEEEGPKAGVVDRVDDEQKEFLTKLEGDRKLVPQLPHTIKKLKKAASMRVNILFLPLTPLIACGRFVGEVQNNLAKTNQNIQYHTEPIPFQPERQSQSLSYNTGRHRVALERQFVRRGHQKHFRKE